MGSRPGTPRAIRRATRCWQELIRLKPDVVVSATIAGIIALKKLTDAIPIVSISLIDPVGFGWVESHARPGGNVTGLLSTVEDLPSKQLALANRNSPWREQDRFAD